MALTDKGLEIRRFNEVLEDLVAAERANIDPNINTRDDEFLGQMNNILALITSDLEQVIQSAVDNMNIDYAGGIWLDKLAAEKGLKRQSAAYSTSDYQLLTGLDGTVVPVGTVLQSVITSDKYETVTQTTISASSCRSITYFVNTLLDSTSYTISVNNTLYNYTSDATATRLEIVNGLKSLIDADVNATWSASVDSVNETITIATSTLADINVSSTTYLSPSSVTVYTSIQATDQGAKVGVANSITTIVSSVGGLTSTTNESDVVVGRDRETDQEFRVRILEADQVRSVATLSAIISRLRNVSGVTQANVIDNDTDVIDAEGRPPHSYEAIVVGGEDIDVANDLWLTKPAGVKLYGNTTTIITDSEGQQRSINFSRPTALNLAFRITYTQYSEESLPSDPDTLIKEIIESTTSSHNIGEDVIPSRFFGPLYTGVTGIDSLTIEVQEITNPGDTPVELNWQTIKLAIASTEYASTSALDITVVAA